MSTADKYPRPWKISASWGGGPKVLNIRDANGTWVATVTSDLAPAFCAVPELIGLVCLLDSMVECGEKHTDRSREMVRAALAKARGEG